MKFDFFFARTTGSFEQSPRLVNQYQDYMGSDEMAVMPAETQLREDLADAMRESPRDSGKFPSNQTDTRLKAIFSICTLG